jgi:carbon-monoxide dehydrogenase medium subunit
VHIFKLTSPGMEGQLDRFLKDKNLGRERRIEKMNANGKFIQAESIEAALEALAEYGDEAKVVAGGTALMLMLEHDLIAPEVLVGIHQIVELDTLELSEKRLELGSMVSLRTLENSSEVKSGLPVLSSACGSVGNVRVRNQATIGGNLGEADYASDPPTVLMVLDAEVSARNVKGSRVIPISEFFYGFFTTDLQPDEIITKIALPIPPVNSRSVYLKYRSRSSEDRPCVGVAALAVMEDGICHDLRVAVGAACEIPTRLSEMESLAQGQPLSDELIAEIADGYASGIEPLEDLRGSSWYRREMTRVYVKRALAEVCNGSG